jgi:hypothetical protein
MLGIVDAEVPVRATPKDNTKAYLHLVLHYIYIYIVRALSVVPCGFDAQKSRIYQIPMGSMHFRGTFPHSTFHL